MEENKLNLTMREGGICEECGGQQDVLYTATMSDGTQIWAKAVCRKCAEKLQAHMDTQIESSAKPSPVLMTAQASASAPIIRKRNSKKIWITVIVCVLIFSVIFGVIFWGLVGLRVGSAKKRKSSQADSKNVAEFTIADDTADDESVESLGREVYRTENFTFFWKSPKYMLGKGYFEFHEGLAWVFASDGDNQKKRFVIDADGRIVYCLNEDRFADLDYNDQICMTPFYNGISCVYSDNSSPGFLIVDKNGNEAYSDLSETYSVCCTADDGMIFLSKHISNISEDYYRLCTIDYNLNIKETNITSDSQFATNFFVKKIQDGIYCTEAELLLDLESDVIIDLNRNIYLDLSYSIKQICGNYIDFYTPSGIFRCSKETFIKTLSKATDEKTFSDALLNQSQDLSEPTNSNSYGFDYFITPMHNGSWLYGEYNSGSVALLDLQGNTIVKSEALPGNATFDFSYGNSAFFGDFSQGFATRIIGADQKDYYTYFNQNGKMQYTPVQIDLSGYSDIEDSYAGYLFLSDYDNSHIIDPHGNEIEMGEAFTEIKDSNSYCGNNVIVSDGWIFFNGTLAKADGSKSFSSVTVNYDKDGNIIYG